MLRRLIDCDSLQPCSIGMATYTVVDIQSHIVRMADLDGREKGTKGSRGNRKNPGPGSLNMESEAPVSLMATVSFSPLQGDKTQDPHLFLGLP